jgi:hypothetical protein
VQCQDAYENTKLQHCSVLLQAPHKKDNATKSKKAVAMQARHKPASRKELTIHHTQARLHAIVPKQYCLFSPVASLLLDTQVSKFYQTSQKNLGCISTAR